MASVVERWVSDFKEDRVAALAEIVNFVLLVRYYIYISLSTHLIINLFHLFLQASGVETSCLSKDLDLEALDADELDDIVRMHLNLNTYIYTYAQIIFLLINTYFLLF